MVPDNEIHSIKEVGNEHLNKDSTKHDLNAASDLHIAALSLCIILKCYYSGTPLNGHPSFVI